MPTDFSNVRAGSFCPIGASGTTTTKDGRKTPMECKPLDTGKRARWRMKAGATPASRARKRQPRTAAEKAADALRPSEVNFLRQQAGLPFDGPLPRNRSQKTKLEKAGFIDGDGNLTDEGRSALRRRTTPTETPDPTPDPAEKNTDTADGRDAPPDTPAGYRWLRRAANDTADAVDRLAPDGDDVPLAKLHEELSDKYTPDDVNRAVRHLADRNEATLDHSGNPKAPSIDYSDTPRDLVSLGHPLEKAAARASTARERLDAIKAMGTRDEVLAHLNDQKYTVAELKQIAGEAGRGVYVRPGASKDELQRAIAQGTVGYRQAADAVRGGEWADSRPPVVTGARTTEPPLRNHWGADDGAVPVSYHADGPVGNTVRALGADRQIDLGAGHSLENYLGRAATQMSRASVPFSDGVAEYRLIRDVLPPDSPARRAVDRILDRVDQPPVPAPELPANTPEPVRTLMAELNEIPLARTASRETGRPADTTVLAEVMTRFAGRRPAVIADQLAMRVANRHHESLGDVGKAHIDAAVRRACEALRDNHT